MIPVLGEVADIANAVIYAAEGDMINAAVSVSSAVPGVGNVVAGARYGARYGDEAVDIAVR